MSPRPSDHGESEATAALAELLARIRAGDAEAETEFHGRFAAGLDLDLAKTMRGATPVQRSYHDQLVHETMLTAFDQIRGEHVELRGTIELRAWLRRVLRNKFLDLCRKLKAEPLEQAPAASESSTSWLHGVWSDCTGILTRLARQEDGRLLRQAIRNLQDRSRELVELRFFWDHSWWEVALELDAGRVDPEASAGQRRDHAERVRKEFEGPVLRELALKLQQQRRLADDATAYGP